jgi:hypothetical protein
LFNHLNDQILKTARLNKENGQLKEQLETRDELQHGNANVAEPTVSEEEYRNLVEENEQLKQQLNTREEANSPAPEHETAQGAKATVPEDEHRNLAEKFNELSKKYQDASQKIKYLERKNTAVMQKNKEMKESVRAWQEYADRQSGKLKPKSEAKAEDRKPQISAAHLLHDDRPHMPSSPVSVATMRTPGSVADLSCSSPAPMVSLPRSVLGRTNWSTSPNTVTGEEDQSPTSSGTPKPRDQGDNSELPRTEDNNYPGRLVSSHVQRVISDNEYHHSANPSSSQTTVDEHYEPASRHAQTLDADDDDVPEFVFERSLKRKRGQPSKSRFEIYADHHSSDGTPIKPYRVKEEQNSSPPTPAYKLMRNETMDLDDPAPRGLKTPRHPKRKSFTHSGAADTPQEQRSNSAPPTQDIKRENADVIDELDISAELPGHQAITSIEVRASSAPNEDTVLRSLDPNVVSSAEQEPPTKRVRQAEIRHQEKYGFLGESGEAPPPMSDDELRLPPHLARKQINRRLQALKKSPQTPAKTSPRTPKARSVDIKSEQHLTPPSSTRVTPTNASRSGLRNQMTKARSKAREDPTPDRPIWFMKPPEERTSVRKNRVSPSKDQARLREKAMTDLSIHDFKANPEFNQGYTYAFSETVRKRGDRACLPGCTNMECCGSKFRAFAEAQGALSTSQEEALLEEYLGDAYDNMQLSQMSSEERCELVLQARTKKMAKESGKHRQAYERPRSPPGFWRVDFPTTQEQLEDREKAKELERKVVQERWLEAHRKGGRWIFRDE